MQGMKFLIKEAFQLVDLFGPHIAKGCYDLLSPDGEIIMRSVWEALIQPGWIITMHMWPLSEPPTEEPLKRGRRNGEARRRTQRQASDDEQTDGDAVDDLLALWTTVAVDD